MERYLIDQIRRDLEEKMVFIAGPRQVGKTTLARRIMTAKDAYLNWDIPSDRARMASYDWPRTPLIVLDEIHKMHQWRSALKGLFDERGRKQRILVTGSAQLDYQRLGGDSLQGRYHLLRMHPLSVAELALEKKKDFESLLRLGGFPEPFLKGDSVAANRWSRDYRTRLVTEEITGLTPIHDVASTETLLMRLPDLVGSPLSINALREDLQVNHETVVRRLHMFERIYAIFRVAPFGSPRIRAVKKEQKHYHLDWNLVSKPGPRLENLVACHLLKWVHFEQDTKGRDLELRYFRDIEGREVDFVVTERTNPVLFVETKWDDAPIDRNLFYIKAKFPDVETWQISAVGKKDEELKEGIRLAPALTFLKRLI